MEHEEEHPFEKNELNLKADFLAIVDDINLMGINYQKVGRECALQVYHCHRTLQQSFWNLISEVTKFYSELCKEYGTDLRNEQAAKYTDKVTVATKDSYFPFI